MGQTGRRQRTPTGKDTASDDWRTLYEVWFSGEPRRLSLASCNRTMCDIFFFLRRITSFNLLFPRFRFIIALINDFYFSLHLNCSQQKLTTFFSRCTIATVSILKTNIGFKSVRKMKKLT